jgi:hypothetical protein
MDCLRIFSFPVKMYEEKADKFSLEYDTEILDYPESLVVG